MYLPLQFKLIEAFLEQATASGTRATVLKPLGWVIGMLIAAILASLPFSPPTWVLIMLAVLVCLTLLVYLIAYVYCLRTDKDALRSETYSIQKMAIEKGFVGDSIIGRLEPPLEEVESLTQPESSRNDEERAS